MSKIITEKEVLDLLNQAFAKPDAMKWAKIKSFTSQDAYRAFLRDMGYLIARHFGGSFKAIGEPNTGDELFYTFSIEWDRYVPDDGGIYANLDTDCGLSDWRDEPKSLPKMFG